MSLDPDTFFSADVALVPALVGQVYQEASPVERSRLLEQLVKPLGLLSLVAVVEPDGVAVVVLVDYAQQLLQLVVAVH